MGRKQKTILFLCTGNHNSSRFAEILFASIARKMGLPWHASSRGLALEQGVNPVGPMAATAIKALETMGIRDAERCGRLPEQATLDDFEKAHAVIALTRADHLPLLRERFPAFAEKVEYWHFDDALAALPMIEREIMGLIARLMGGGRASAHFRHSGLTRALAA